MPVLISVSKSEKIDKHIEHDRDTPALMDSPNCLFWTPAVSYYARPTSIRLAFKTQTYIAYFIVAGVYSRLFPIQ